MKHTAIIQNLLVFLNHSPSAWQAVSLSCNHLVELGFEILSEKEKWAIQPGRGYIVTRNGSSLCAFITPKKIPRSMRLIGSHTDSPSLKLKPIPEIRKQGALLLGVEVYGSPLLHSWLNRDLGIAGRVFITDRNDVLHEHIVCLDQYPVIIPQLAIHLDREVNEKGLQLNKQEHLYALAAIDSSLENDSFLETILREKIHFKNLVSHDLFLFPLENARLLGYDHSLIAGYRIDSLASIHAAIYALSQSLEPFDNELKMIICWDHEEIGSHTYQGASSPFFNQIVERIVSSYEGTREDYFCLLNRSLCMSVDLAHAVHPNYPEKHDANHQPLLGQGIVLKHNAQQRYATSAYSSLPVHRISSQKKIPIQHFVSRNDIPCGTTIGPIQSTKTGIPTVDLGCAQLSMHSCREIIACRDHVYLCDFLENFLQNDELFSSSWN